MKAFNISITICWWQFVGYKYILPQRRGDAEEQPIQTGIDVIKMIGCDLLRRRTSNTNTFYRRDAVTQGTFLCVSASLRLLYFCTYFDF